MYEKIKDIDGIREEFRDNLIDVSSSYLILGKYEKSYELLKYLIAEKLFKKEIKPVDYSIMFADLLIASYNYKGVNAAKNVYNKIL